MGQKSVLISMNAKQAIILAIWRHMTASIQTARSHVRQKLEVYPQVKVDSQAEVAPQAKVDSQAEVDPQAEV